MRIINLTPFPHMLFERGTHGGIPLGVLVVQATCAFDGDQLLPLAAQPDITATDAVRGTPGKSSITTPSALATFKPNADITLDAVAYAPQGRAREQWPVRARVGKRSVDLMIRGPHEWTHGAFGWSCSAPRPALCVPIIYENAFGGRHELDKPIEEPRNPLGTGFIPSGVPCDRPIAAAQIVATDEPHHRAGRRYKPHGLGAIAPYFAPRRNRIGTLDEHWLAHTWPRPPRDFDYASFQHAHPDLVYDGYLRGDEPVELIHLLPGGKSKLTALPGFSLCAKVAFVNGTQHRLPMVLDTAHFAIASSNYREHRLQLVWRALVPLAGGIKALAFNTYWLN